MMLSRLRRPAKIAPEYIENQINQNVAIFGDFLVCPFTRSQPGEMQLVCIEAGKTLVVRKQK